MTYNNRKNLKQLSTKNPYWLPHAAFYSAYYFALRYQEFLDELEALGDGARGISYDSQPHGDSTGTVLEDLAIKRAKVSSYIDLIESSCLEADREIAPYLLKAVTNIDVGYDYLDHLGMPCGRGTFYKRRRKFYYILSKKLDNR